MSTLPTLALTAAFVSAPTALSSRIRNESFSIARGTTQPSLTGLIADAGSYTTTLNNRDRALDPSHAGGPYYTDLVPGVPVSLVATWNAVDYPLFNGFVGQWPQIYPGFKADQITELQCYDAIRNLARAQTTAIYPRELTGDRLDEIVTDIGYPGATLMGNGTTYVPFVGDGQSSSSAWALMTDAANAEWGLLFVDSAGVLQFYGRDDIFGAGFDTPVATFGDAGGAELPYADIVVQYDDQQIVNDADLLFNQYGIKAHAEDLTSQGKPWGKLSWQQNFQLASGALARSLVHEVVRRYANPAVRVDQVVIKPQHSPSTLWPVVLGTELGSMFTVKVTPKGGGSRISLNCYVRHIQHAYSNNDWTVTYTLQSGSLNTINNLYDDGALYDGGQLYAF